MILELKDVKNNKYNDKKNNHPKLYKPDNDAELEL